MFSDVNEWADMGGRGGMIKQINSLSAKGHVEFTDNKWVKLTPKGIEKGRVLKARAEDYQQFKRGAMKGGGTERMGRGHSNITSEPSGHRISNTPIFNSRNATPASVQANIARYK
jgi:hypothetical protein